MLLSAINKKRRHAVEKHPHGVFDLGRERRFGNRRAHQLHPAIASTLIDAERRMPGAQPRMPSLLEIPNRSPKSIDQEVSKARLGARQILGRIHRPEHIVLRDPSVERRDHSRDALFSDSREDVGFLHQAGGTRTAKYTNSFISTRPMAPE